MEPTTRHASLAKKEGARLAERCRIHVLSRTHRLADSDGRSAKAVVDGLVLAGILADDSPEFVKEISHSQELTKDAEETVITLVWGKD